MNVPTSASPWQPLTFGGVAAFAAGTFGRLGRLLAFASLFCTACLLWFIVAVVVPVVDQAVARLPDQGVIRGGRLQWPLSGVTQLATSPVLAIQVDPTPPRAGGAASDLEVVFGPESLRLGCLLGQVRIPYPTGYEVALSHDAADAWWKAWQPAFVAGFGVGTFLGLLGTWGILATLYTGPVRTVAFYADRGLSWTGAWRLSAAALMPGAMLVSVAVVFYGLHRLSLPALLLAWLVHLPVGWLYAFIAPFCLPRNLSTASNPFGSDEGGEGAKPKRRNPFAGPRRSA